jgi:hypothetical protein
MVEVFDGSIKISQSSAPVKCRRVDLHSKSPVGKHMATQTFYSPGYGHRFPRLPHQRAGAR